MSKLEERENRRKKSIVGSMIDDKKDEVEPKKTQANSKRVQKSYYLDKDLFKALQLKSIQEEINLTEAMNTALRKGLERYL